MFYNVISELVLALAVSDAGSILSQLFPVRSRVVPGGLCCLTLILSDHAGRWGFVGFRRRSVPDRLEVPGIAPGRNENTKEMHDKSETASTPGRFELEKYEKNRRNLRLIQTCDFFILCILYIIFYNVSWHDVNFSFQHIQLIIFHIFPSYGTSNLSSSSLLPACFFFSAFCRILADCSHACCSFPYISFIF